MQTTYSNKSNKTKQILFYDITETISRNSIRNVESVLHTSVSIQHTIPEHLDVYDLIICYIDGDYNENKKVIHEVMAKSNNLEVPILLVTGHSVQRVLQYLSFPISGIVTLHYFIRYCPIVVKDLLKEGVFLEPSFQRELAKQIDESQSSNKPIKKLLLCHDRIHIKLSENEKDALQLILDGYNNRTISQKMYLAPTTINTIISNLLKKIGANDRTDAMIKAIRSGWVDPVR
ncbi:response regulator transcription factor [Evansella cellulosilytica]|uniref:Transcriptional regulator, LuxR family n=1 Tax=Evansella cellulosilytica (strain ATCC 21833 / DSM 2522 / FERM P-1141 / JCM 9156 / N-4) TaxID=649639 RepID=E6TS92_EVAC2|nr:LuxR C-terminal-related transcriptional regulator [Evansella cellulosilytica]ADU31861.1 transcriptional regulator, LuxR family [Evansella cellulosilytica DSM 2522]